jgi:ribonuclease G
MKRKIIFNVGEHLTRVAILEGQELVELFIEKNDNVNAVGNIYKGVVQEVIPSLQAIFVDIGTGKNAFLHFNDVDLEPFIAEAIRDRQSVRRRSRNRPREGAAPDQGYYIRVEDCISRGREIMVQMTKEPISTKGARISANLALPGRCLVMMPGTEGKGGVSKKVEDMAERRRLKKILAKIDVPDCSFIIRTAGIGRSAREIYADVDNLLDRWEDVQQNFRKAKGPTLLSSEQDFFSRLIRDHFPDDIEEIIVDHAESRDQIVAAMSEIMPDLVGQVKLYKDPRNIFERYRVERSIYTALQRRVPLKSGGYLIIDECEALTVIDINSGSFTKGGQQEKMIQRVNVEACEEIARQLRLRDIGGLIIIDFIDMATRDGQRKVADTLRDELHKDRTKVSIGRFSDFGTLELTRKRVRNSLRNTLTKECPYCGGSGRIAIESIVWKQIRYELQGQLSAHKGGNYELIVHPHISDYVSEHLPHRLAAWEKEYGVRIDIRVQKTYHFETFAIVRNGKTLIESGMEKIESFHDVEYIESAARNGDEPVLRTGRVEEEDVDRGGRPNRAGRRRRGGRGADEDESPRRPEPLPAADSDEFEVVAEEIEEVEAAPPAAEGEGGEDTRPRRRRRGGRGRRRREDEPTQGVAPASASVAGSEEEDEDDDTSPRRRRRRLGAREAFLVQQEVAPRPEPAVEPDEDDENFLEVVAAEFEEDDDEEIDEEAADAVFEEDDEIEDEDEDDDEGEQVVAEGTDTVEELEAVPASAAQAAPDRRIARPPVRRDHSSTMYGDLAGVVTIRRKTKRPRFDHNQKPLSHYSEISLGHRVGSGLPAKVPRAASATIDLEGGMKTESSLLTRDYKEATSGRRTSRPDAGAAPKVSPKSAPKVASKKTTASSIAARSAAEDEARNPAAKSTTTRKTAAKKAATAAKSATTAAKKPAAQKAPVKRSEAPAPAKKKAPTSTKTAAKKSAASKSSGAASKAQKAPAKKTAAAKQSPSKPTKGRSRGR